MKEIIKPLVHMNGTHPRDLFREYDNAYWKVREAFDALQTVTVNGRDYYPLGPDAINKALKQHGEYIMHLAAVRSYLNEMRTYLVPFTGVGFMDARKEQQ